MKYISCIYLLLDWLWVGVKYEYIGALSQRAAAAENGHSNMCFG